MKDRKIRGGHDQFQIDGMPALLEVVEYIGDAKEVVGRTLPRLQHIVDSGARLIGQGLTTIGDIVELVEFLDARRDKFPGLFPAPTARAKLAPHPWGNAQPPPPIAKHRRAKSGTSKLTLEEKDRIRFYVVRAEVKGERAVRAVRKNVTKEFGITEREINQLMRCANGGFAEDFLKRIITAAPAHERAALAKELVYFRPHTYQLAPDFVPKGQ